MSVVLGRPGPWTEGFRVEVTSGQARAYAVATNETDPRFIAGTLAPPLFGTVIIRPAMQAVFAHSMPEGLPASVPRLAGEHDIFIRQSIIPGMFVNCRAKFIGISPKSSGTVLAYKFETYVDSSGELLNEQYMTTFLPAVRWSEEIGEQGPDHRIPPEIQDAAHMTRVIQRFDEDQTFRYSAASDDPSRWHLDKDYAKAAGLPGIIIHGLCTMAFVGRAVMDAVADGDATRLRRLAVRFSRPIFPGNEMTTVIWRGENLVDGTRCYCEATRPDGQKVISNGLAEIAG